MRLDGLYAFSNPDLRDIYKKLNNWKWDSRLGEKPDNWDNLPHYSPDINKTSKTMYVTPILNRIALLLGEDNLKDLKYEIISETQ